MNPASSHTTVTWGSVRGDKLRGDGKGNEISIYGLSFGFYSPLCPISVIYEMKFLFKLCTFHVLVAQVTLLE